MNQLFVTLRDAEQCATDVVRLLDSAIESRHRRRLWRAKLEHARDTLYRTVEEFGPTEFLDDAGSPAIKLFDALAFVTTAASAFQWDQASVNEARDILVSVAR